MTTTFHVRMTAVNINYKRECESAAGTGVLILQKIHDQTVSNIQN